MRKSLALFAILAAGCGGIKQGDLVGSWDCSVELSDATLQGAVAQAKITSGADVSKDEVKKLILQTPSGMTLNADETFNMNIGPATYSGKWKFDSMTITLSVETMMGLPVDQAAAQFKLPAASVAQIRQPMKLNLAKDGKSATGTSPGDVGTVLTFTKKGSP